MSNRNIIKLFETRRGNLDHHLKRDYVRNGIVTLPYIISDYNEVISTYSVKGYEALNMAFSDHLKTEVEFAPPEYPIVLNIIGDCLSQTDKKIITDTIQDTFVYEFGMLEKEEKRHTKVFILLIVGLILSGILLYFTHDVIDELRELFFVLFWFMGYTLCDYIFLTGHDIRHNRIMAGRLASIKVVFLKNYEDPNYTKSDVDRLYSEIEKDVRESMQDE